MKQDFDYFVQANIKKGFYYFFQFQQTSTTSVTLFQFHKVSAKCFALCFSSKHINVELYFLIKRKKKNKDQERILMFLFQGNQQIFLLFGFIQTKKHYSNVLTFRMIQRNINKEYYSFFY